MSARGFAVDVIDVRGRERAIKQTINTEQTVFISARQINVGKPLGIVGRLDQVKGVIVLANTAAGRSEDFA